jgi:hypothetical protein
MLRRRRNLDVYSHAMPGMQSQAAEQASPMIRGRLGGHFPSEQPNKGTKAHLVRPIHRGDQINDIWVGL